MYGHAARNDRGSAVAKNRPDRPDAHRCAAVEQRMRSRAERVQVLGDRRVRVIAARDREVARGLTQQHAEALDVARRLRAQASALRGLDRRFELCPARLPLGDEGVEAHRCRSIELQVHALDEQLRRPAPFGCVGREREPLEQPLRDVGREARAQLRAQPRARQEDSQRVALEGAEPLDAVDRRARRRECGG